LREVISSDETIQQMGLRARAYGREITREGQVRAIVQCVAPDWLAEKADGVSTYPPPEGTTTDVHTLTSGVAVSKQA